MILQKGCLISLLLKLYSKFYSFRVFKTWKVCARENEIIYGCFGLRLTYDTPCLFDPFSLSFKQGFPLQGLNQNKQSQ